MAYGCSRGSLLHNQLSDVDARVWTLRIQVCVRCRLELYETGADAVVAPARELPDAVELMVRELRAGDHSILELDRGILNSLVAHEAK